MDNKNNTVTVHGSVSNDKIKRSVETYLKKVVRIYGHQEQVEKSTVYEVRL